MKREKRGDYMIEASASRLPGSTKWQPRLMMTRIAHGLPQKCQAFPGLTTIFETSAGATQYALDLGRSFADNGSARLTV